MQQGQLMLLSKGCGLKDLHTQPGGLVTVLGRVVAVSDNFLLRYQLFLGLESLRFRQPRNVVDLRLERRGVLGGEVRIVRVGF